MFCYAEDKRMHRAIAVSMILALAFWLPFALFAGEGDAFEERGDYTPVPRLIAPTTEKVVITDVKELEFTWSPHEGRRGNREYYDFRLYQGYRLVEKALIIKRKVDPDVYRTGVSASSFNDGQVYTWSLRQVYDGLHKSARSTASFMVIKK